MQAEENRKIVEKLSGLADETSSCILDRIQFKNYFMQYINSNFTQRKALGFVCDYQNSQEYLCLAIANLLRKDFLSISSTEILTTLRLCGHQDNEGGLSIIVQRITDRILTKKSSNILVLIEGLAIPNVSHNNILNILRHGIEQYLEEIQSRTKLALSGIKLTQLFFVFSTMDSANIPLLLHYCIEFIRLRPISTSEMVMLLHNSVIQQQFPIKFFVEYSSLQPLFYKYGKALNLSSLIELLHQVLTFKLRKKFIKDHREKIELSTRDLEAFLQISIDDRTCSIPRPSIGAIDVVGISDGYGVIQQYEVKVFSGAGNINLCCHKSESLVDSINIALAVVKQSLPDNHVSNIERSDIYFNIDKDRFHLSGRSSSLGIALCIYSALYSLQVYPSLCVTGELDLNQNVQPVGGLINKIITAYDQNFKQVIIPACQQHLLREIPNFIQEGLQITPVANFGEAVEFSMKNVAIHKSMDTFN